MSSEPIKQNFLLDVKGVSKTYRVWKNPIDRLKALIYEQLSRRLKQSPLKGWLDLRCKALYNPIEALKETSLRVGRGEAIGIIGRNGAGKSTLLQIITGSLNPSTGKILRQGKIAALLELGSGFDPESTGIENVKINASLLGLTNGEIDAKLNSILEYANIGDFVYQPVRTYSSGMRMRLAFAVAAHVEADVIIIDEALGVGDARFQLKCSKTIEGHLKKGRALLFVSHNMNAVKLLCDRAILLHDGEKLMESDPNSVANIYSRIVAGDAIDQVRNHIKLLNTGFEKKTQTGLVSDETGLDSTYEFEKTDYDVIALRSRLAVLSDPSQQKRIEALLRESMKTKTESMTEFNYGGDLGRISNINSYNNEEVDKQVFQTGEYFSISFDVESNENFDVPIYAMTIKNTVGQEVYVCNTMYRGIIVPSIKSNEKKRVVFRQKMNLMQGDYFISLGFVTFIGEDLLVIHRRYDVIKIQVLPEDRCLGIANMDSKIEVRDVFSHEN